MKYMNNVGDNQGYIHVQLIFCEDLLFIHWDFIVTYFKEDMYTGSIYFEYFCSFYEANGQCGQFT